MYNIIMKKKMFLHSCCAPCSTSVIDRLKEEFDLTIFYYNPNIFPQEEYAKRLKEQCRYVEEAGLNIFVIDGTYDDFEKFDECLRPYAAEAEGGRRCEKCISLRLAKTAQEAKRRGYDIFASTLSVSPHKNALFINELGKSLSEKFGLEFLCADFKKKDGYLNSIKASKKFEIYRQKYCGCKYSMKEKDSFKRKG